MLNLNIDAGFASSRSSTTPAASNMLPAAMNKYMISIAMLNFWQLLHGRQCGCCADVPAGRRMRIL